MALTGDFASLARATRSIRGLVTPGSPQRKAIAKAAVVAVKALTREQFAKGIGPDGAPNRPRKDGKPALQSEKLARGALGVEMSGDAIHFFMKNPKWSRKLDAHQEGHTFPPSRSRQFRNSKGRLTTLRKYVRSTRRAGYERTGDESYTNVIRRLKSGKTKTIGRKTVTHVGARVLPPTPVYPAGGNVLTRRWEVGIGDEIAQSVIRSLATVKK